MGRDEELSAVLYPAEGILRRHRLLAEYIKSGGPDKPIFKGIAQILLDDDGAASEI